MRRRLLLALIVVLCLAAPASGHDVVGKKHRIDEKISALSSKIAAARAKEQRLNAQIADVSADIRELEAEVGDVSNDLVALERDLALHQAKLDKITELFRLETRKLGFLRDQHHAAVDRLHARVIALYESGEVGSLDILLSAKSFDDLLAELDYVKHIAAQDRRIATAVGEAKERMRIQRARTKRSRARIAAVTRVVQIRTAQQRELRDRLVSNRNELAQARNAKRSTLESVQESKAEFIAEVDALSRVSAQLGAQIRSSQGAPSSSSPPVVRSSSGFVWPVAGPVTSGFGMRWGRMHEGIDIAAPTGAPIRAAASGRVIYAGWMSGYGNLVVVDHGGGLATAYAHASSIAVGNGASVAQGQTIAYVGCTGHCFGSHLHFEVRVNGSAVDPLGYL